jgi:hypothetical protein
MNRSVLFLLLTFLLPVAELYAQDVYFPPTDSDHWENISEEELGWNLDWRDSLITFAAEQQSKALLILKDGRIVVEEYFGTFEKDSLWVWYSAGKSY